MDDTSKDRLGIIAGGGAIPQLLVQACETEQRPYTVVGLKGHADSLANAPAIWARVGQAGKCFQKFHEDKVSSVVMAGRVMRPGLFDLRPDWRTIKFLARAGTKAFIKKDSVGDDRLLRSVIAEIEREGFSVVGVDSVLSDLIALPGAVGTISPSQEDQQDIAAGLIAAREHGAADRGQAVIVRDGSIVAREGIEGTDSLIRGAADLPSTGSKPILVKASKPQQDRRADLPVIGPETINACIASGFRGIAIEAGGTLIVDRKSMAELADRAGLFIYAVGDEPSEGMS
ncbi:MAG: UDP-2,3-diacylglucosamine diphosphatase LpxI [Rhodospirillaceae bacterium]|jgi:UDP-2,3-diacylglucosamine hydrolase|nr:UDP-2,3-diacylglucosamine diphosphatase LpxI [Rhodospirillaceae bacterium]MBT5239551.1 UDP-2,3-diacylglucosamine diphosphatase LpxI [Rhodospirillaceae bacterium]MBT5564169.1 UDP-2,3-diacylglucosamine diphosphatase LpxI [Rhodospirillaceae bacterium]MBT6089964.1 UDP-2,3-diacylglucosamine diphosphatase LpxI [Rhodospirillaceae bacterium]MBT6960345.1 UDP-2,3-diacylglucosamine diphosphatase LpxI [Rhodospirillaceae bacterium]